MTDSPSTIAEQRRDLLRQVVFNRAMDVPGSQPELFRAEVGLVVHGFMADFYAAALAEVAPERAEQVAAELAEYLDDGALPEYAWERAVALGHNPRQWVAEYEAAREKRATSPDTDWRPNGGHSPMCAYVAGMSNRCTCD